MSALADYINGYAFKPDDWSKDGLPIIRIEQLKNPEGSSDYYAGNLPPAVIIDDGDLIFSWSASLFLRIWTHGRAALNQHLFKVVERDGVNRFFLKAFIEFYLPDLTRASHGSTMRHITRKELDRFAAPLPACGQEQSKIAEVLSTVDRAIAQTEALIGKQQRIKTGLMRDLLTRGIDEHGQLRSEATHAFKDSPLGRIPVEWEVDVGSKYFSLHAGIPTSAIDWNSDGNTLYLKVDDFNAPQNVDGIVAAENCFNCPSGLQGRMLAPGTLVFPKRGAAIFLNRVGVLRKQATLDPNLMGLRVKEDVAAEFLKLVLLNSNLGTICDNSGIPQINNKHLYPLEFSMPSYREQEEIVKRTRQTELGVLSTSTILGKLRALKTALMQDLLTGKVRVTPLLQKTEEAVSA